MNKIILLIIVCPLLLSSCNHMSNNIRIQKSSSIVKLLDCKNKEKLYFLTSHIKNNILCKKQTKKSLTIAKHNIISTPVIANGVIYSSDEKGIVSAYSLQLQKIVWSTDISLETDRVVDQKYNNGGVLYSNGQLYVTNSSRYLIILDAKSGDEIIRKRCPDIIKNKPVMATDELVLLQTISNELIAYDVTTSKFLWIHEGQFENLTTKHNIEPVVYNGHVLVSYSSGEIAYIDVKTGKEKWCYNLAHTISSSNLQFDPFVMVTTPNISSEYAYFATSNGQIIKMDLDNGAPAWIKIIKDVQSLRLIDEYLLLINSSRQVVALSAHNGQVVWSGDLTIGKHDENNNESTVLFQAPFVSRDGKNFIINVLSCKGKLYQFKTDTLGFFVSEPLIYQVIDSSYSIKDYWLSSIHNKLYFITGRSIMYLEENNEILQYINRNT